MIMKSLKWKSRLYWYSLIIAICWSSFAASSLHGQTNPSGVTLLQQSTGAPKFVLVPPTRFDVISIHPDRNAGRFMGLSFSANSFTLTNLPIQMLLKTAFGVREDRLLNVPDWAKNERFDINAKLVDPNAPKMWTLTKDQRGQMLLSLLADRFDLQYHHETRQLREYRLRIAKGGLKLKPSNPSNSGANGDQATERQVLGYGHLDAQGDTVSRLITGLEVVLGSTIVDETGLVGRYDVALRWTPDMDRIPTSGTTVSGQSSLNADSPTGNLEPSIFTALKEQLGLELKPAKGPVDIIVIDHIEPPSSN